MLYVDSAILTLALSDTTNATTAFLRVCQPFGCYSLITFGINDAEKAASVVFVAGGTSLFHFNQQGIFVAIHVDFFNHLNVTGCFALNPELLP